MKMLRLILGDQLNSNHSWYKETSDDVLYVLMELKQETNYVKHHIQKVVAFFASMEAFSQTLLINGHKCEYWKINDSQNTGDLIKNLTAIIQRENIQQFEYQLPDEYRLDEQIKDFCKTLQIPSYACDTEHFITSRDELKEIFAGKKMYLMETFYRVQRKKTGILMDNENPVGGQWNFDHDNRNKYDGKVPLPPDSTVKSNQTEIYKRIVESGVETIGNIDAVNFIWPVNKTQALKVVEEFIQFRLPWFGTYQDALTTADNFLFHSRISFALNSKILHPLEVITPCIEAWEKDSARISINQLEGFVRQIIGWREYMRGIYWLKMPDYAHLNYFNHVRPLPSWFWSGKTKMKCLQHAIGQSLDTAYAHHIQRLMVTGNFALLAGIHPDQIDEWYLGIYIDAIEWVEITNTRGMSQFADGGIVGTKPYVSSAAYIDKMGNYCGQCFYNKKEKIGENACPFNSLFWHFYHRHENKLSKNPRIGMMYQTWKKMSPEAQHELLKQAEVNLKRIEYL
jgi:deoxyribodipyrimidine photolyase-related protein